jgi:hypothetical protein
MRNVLRELGQAAGGSSLIGARIASSDLENADA